MACEMAAVSEAEQLHLFHHDLTYPAEIIVGMEASAKTHFRKAQVAYEGLEIVLHDINKITERLQWCCSRNKD